MMSEQITKISVRYNESFMTYQFREEVEINIEDYPELQGLSLEEIQEYIDQNSEDMKPTQDFYSSLYEEITDKDVVHDKITSEEGDFEVRLG